MTPHQPGDWQHLAEQASNEQDSETLIRLVTELNRVLSEREETTRQQRRHMSVR